MKRACTALLAVIAMGAAFTGGALADDSSFSEVQSPDDQLFHIDVGASYLNVGQPPRQNNVGAGTIRISLPSAKARFDPALAIDQSGYTCSVTTSAYGEAGTGFVCSTDGQVQGDGLAFPNAVTVHLLSADCYAPPPQGSAYPAIAEVWAAPGDPGTPPDETFPLYADPGCDNNAAEPPVDNVAGAKCVVPRLKNLTLAKATLRLKRAGCARGTVKRVYSRSLKKGRVLSQSLKAGKRTALGAKVMLVLSLGIKQKPARR